MNHSRSRVTKDFRLCRVYGVGRGVTRSGKL